MRNTAAPCYEGPGAMVGNLFMSLIHTAELQHREPFDYLVTLRSPDLRDSNVTLVQRKVGPAPGRHGGG